VLFFHGKHSDCAEILCQKGPACSSVFFFAHDKPLLFLTCRKSVGKMLQVAAGPLLQRTTSAPHLCNHATGLHLQRMSSASSLLKNDENGFLMVETSKLRAS